MPNDDTDAAPLIAAKSPAKVELKKGETYFWCRCGRSKNQPFCDGSHKGTGLAPLEFTADEDGDAYLCRCKGTSDAPFCDGTHNKLPEDLDVGDPVPEADTDDGPPEPEPTPEEPTVARIHEIARKGISSGHGAMDAMGVPRDRLPKWEDIQLLPAQLAKKPLLDDAEVATETVIGPRADKPLTLQIPLFVTDMSFGALSPEAKLALAKGAEAAGTGIASGEGGMMPEEQEANGRYFYEYASAVFGWTPDIAQKVQAFHFKGGQAAKTGIGGHLPASKVTDKIAEVRGLEKGEDAVSPATFENLHTPAEFARFADEVRDMSGGIPVGFKISANHIEDDIDFALEAGADYVILDGRGGGTGAAPLLFRDNISIPTIPALARARAHLDRKAGRDVTLVITGGLRMPEDFAKALALGADAVALGNSAIQAVGCVAARMCHTNNCPTGVATQKPELRKRLDVEAGADRLARFFDASTQMMSALARACGHSALSEFRPFDITTFDRDMAALTGIRFAGVAG
ncbi:glutamate synthase-related protein [Maritimibacter dapengensis]|uniref:CDGSH iron-sulfur domain-containing protein n=1 Tax=Maritimibacter dapengensis TaxID=2836868 RepID=A0ABS6T286_9RHOB|nr:glutamate synthase-related protein [Maritimibacter dapengensis]MBV7379310.1 CDGSH iron-sulfur domain-containing protein [Maritimibacter dapengensis]